MGLHNSKKFRSIKVYNSCRACSGGYHNSFYFSVIKLEKTMFLKLPALPLSQLTVHTAIVKYSSWSTQNKEMLLVCRGIYEIFFICKKTPTKWSINPYLFIWLENRILKNLLIYEKIKMLLLLFTYFCIWLSQTSKNPPAVRDAVVLEKKKSHCFPSNILHLNVRNFFS